MKLVGSINWLLRCGGGVTTVGMPGAPGSLDVAVECLLVAAKCFPVVQQATLIPRPLAHVTRTGPSLARRLSES
jgi:hypothetical protein